MRFVQTMMALALFLAPRVQADEKSVEILCLGDSLTAGVGGDGTSWPAELSKLSGANIVNRGAPGWIPRHLKYRFYLQDCPVLSKGQLRAIPPQEYENRIHQPQINQVRSFLEDGMQVKIRSDKSGEVEVYRWESQSLANGDGFLCPDIYSTTTTRGRWVRQGREISGESPSPKAAAICVIWMGANGMQADDVRQSLSEILAELHSRSIRVLVLGLVNRLPSESSPDAIASWTQWIGECNEVIQKLAPENYLDLQAWMTASGSNAGSGYRTRDWFPEATDEAVAADLRDQAAGIMPSSLRPQSDITHINATGYRMIARLVNQALRERGWL